MLWFFNYLSHLYFLSLHFFKEFVKNCNLNSFQMLQHLLEFRTCTFTKCTLKHPRNLSSKSHSPKKKTEERAKWMWSYHATNLYQKLTDIDTKKRESSYDGLKAGKGSERKAKKRRKTSVRRGRVARQREKKMSRSFRDIFFACTLLRVIIYEVVVQEMCAKNQLSRVDEFMGVPDGGRRVAVVRPEEIGRGFHNFALSSSRNSLLLSSSRSRFLAFFDLLHRR